MTTMYFANFEIAQNINGQRYQNLADPAIRSHEITIDVADDGTFLAHLPDGEVTAGHASMQEAEARAIVIMRGANWKSTRQEASGQT